MPECRNHEESLLQDVLGELPASVRRDRWQEHLRACEGCRRERQRMAHLLGKVRSNFRTPALSPREADAMAAAISRKLSSDEPASLGRRWWRPGWVPTLAAACGLLVAVAVGYQLGGRFLANGKLGESAQESQISVQDLDVVSQLDLLKNLSTIEKLVQVVDEPASGSPPATNGNSETQGAEADENERAVS
jgi:anti-sigma factor RsiW